MVKKKTLCRASRCVGIRLRRVKNRKIATFSIFVVKGADEGAES
jgi:hypothetical protein